MEKKEIFRQNRAVYTAATVACGWAGAVWQLGRDSNSYMLFFCPKTPKNKKWLRRDKLITDNWTDGRTDGLTNQPT